MRRHGVPSILSLIVLAAACATATSAGAQNSPARPYKPVAITLPAGKGDPSLDAFRKEIGEIAARKDRAALASRVTAKGFVWERADGKKTDSRRSGFDQLAAALGLSDPDGAGWEALAAIAAEANVAPVPGMQNVVCAPAGPQFDEAQLDQLAQATQTDPLEWVYPTADGVQVRAKAEDGAPVIERLGLHFVRAMEAASQEDAAANGEWLQVVAPSGQTGFVRFDDVRGLETDQICYAKQGGNWKIAGYIGGGE